MNKKELCKRIVVLSLSVLFGASQLLAQDIITSRVNTENILSDKLGDYVLFDYDGVVNDFAKLLSTMSYEQQLKYLNETYKFKSDTKFYLVYTTSYILTDFNFFNSKGKFDTTLIKYIVAEVLHNEGWHISQKDDKYILFKK